jgi:lipopolysaccharide export LptBFGC system permease protein LptF
LPFSILLVPFSSPFFSFTSFISFVNSNFFFPKVEIYKKKKKKKNYKKLKRKKKDDRYKKRKKIMTNERKKTMWKKRNNMKKSRGIKRRGKISYDGKENEKIRTTGRR